MFVGKDHPCVSSTSKAALESRVGPFFTHTPPGAKTRPSLKKELFCISTVHTRQTTFFFFARKRHPFLFFPNPLRLVRLCDVVSVRLLSSQEEGLEPPPVRSFVLCNLS